MDSLTWKQAQDQIILVLLENFLVESQKKRKGSIREPFLKQR